MIEKNKQINDRRSEILHMSEGQLVWKGLDLHVVGSAVATDVWVSQREGLQFQPHLHNNY
jgi:hypothetical protein